jgi:hypothetical protein
MEAGIEAAARAAIRAQTQTQIGPAIPVFNGNKPFTIEPEQWIQRIEQAKRAGAWSNKQKWAWFLQPYKTVLSDDTMP